MSFWRFKFAPAAANSIDSLLNAIPVPPTPYTPPTPTDIALFDTTLDGLLVATDLLSEIKGGENRKLVDFLAKEHVVLRLGGWIVWGLGGEEEDEAEEVEGAAAVGIVADDVEDGKVPDGMVPTPGSGLKKKLGVGRVTRRRDMDLLGVLEGGTPETVEEKACAGNPRLSTEILASDASGLTDILFNHAAASSQPDSCPSPSSFLIPFWEAVLRSTETQLETRSIQVGYWARVNSVLLTGSKGSEVLAVILSIPHLLPRLLVLLPICSPINDILLLLLRISKPPSPLTTSLVPQTLRMLDPLAPLGKGGHVAADELLRGVIELCSTAAPPLPPPPNNNSGASQAPSHIQDVEWRENGLARQIAGERSIRILVDWMLAGTEERFEASTGRFGVDDTPRAGIFELPKVSAITREDDLRTSSLIQSISVLVDLIRKNNSDFVEQQMLAWARRKEMEEKEKELTELGGEEAVDRAGSIDQDKGPSLVDLGPLLTVIAERLAGFQELIRKPRSLAGPVPTSAGSITPLTLERFRICEFYAELLHCSNMSLVNRPVSLSHLYDSEGYLTEGWRAADDLSDALAGPSNEEDDQDSRFISSPGRLSRSSFSTSSAIDVPSIYSGTSTPSGQGSIDTESGILTRAEAKELRDMLVGAEVDPQDEGEEENPFEDPINQSEVDLVVATNGLDLGPKFARRIAPLSRSGSVKKVVEIIAPGLLLKKKFMEHRVIETVLDLFFDFPWNNFLHNVVFDIVQQIFHGRIDRTLDRQLALSIFLDGRIIDRILGGQRANDAACARPQGTRLGYMGHMSLIAEEIVKFFQRYPTEIYAIVEPHIPQPGWDHYVSTTLRETRERDLAALGGGVSMVSHDAASIRSGLSDEDDEFPMSGTRVMRAVEMSGHAGGGAAIDEGAFGGHARASNNTDVGEAGSTDKFSRYLANAISPERSNTFGSSDEDDEDEDDADAGWLGTSQFDSGDVDFSLGENSTGPTKFGFDERFESAGQAFRTASPDSDDDGDWGAFKSDPIRTKSNLFTATNDDGFPPTIASTSAAGFESSFHPPPSFDDTFGDDDFNISSSSSTPSSSFIPDEDDFGDFETATSSPSITLPTLESEASLTDFDFNESTKVTPLAFEGEGSNRPSFGRTMTADDGSKFFGGLSSDGPFEAADLATSQEEPLGPYLHPGTHLTEEGKLEARIDGKIVTVPADEIVVAHNRRSSSSSLT